MKRIGAILLLISLLAMPAWAEPPAPAVFETPEAAALAFYDRVAQADLEGALNLMPADALARSADLVESIELMRIYAMFAPFSLPSLQHPAYAPLNAAKFRAQNAAGIGFLATSLLVHPDLVSGQPLRLEEDGLHLPGDEVLTPEELVERMDPAGLKELKTLHVFRFAPEDRPELMERITGETSALYGGIILESAQLITVLSLNDRLYRHGMTAFRLEDGWQLASLTAPAADAPASGMAEPLQGFQLEELKADADYKAVYTAP